MVNMPEQSEAVFSVDPEYFMLKQCLEMKARGCCSHVFLSLMSYSLLWFVKINTELLRGVFTTQRFDTPV